MTMKKVVDANFAVGATQTDILQLNENYVPVGIIISSSYVSGSLMSFLVSGDGTNFHPLYNSSSTEVTLTITSASRGYALDPDAFLGWNFVKARLGTSGSSKAQATQPQPIMFILKEIQ